MVLYKFCKKEFNIALGCTTLKLGTLQEYREMDPSFSIADEWEGISQATSNNNFVTFTGEELINSKLTIPAIGIGGKDAQISINGQMIMKIPNVYIFCLSLNETNNSLVEYDSKYCISDPQLFANELLRIFVSQFKLSDLEEINFSFPELQMLRINCYHQRVEYLKKPFLFTQENKLEILSILNNPLSAYFKKSIEKSDDLEYRFVIVPSIGQKIIGVKKEAKILNFKPFNGIVNS